jgi:hypothetical protein
MERLGSANLWDLICRGSNQTLVLASSISMQMPRELRFDVLGRLNRDNEVAGQICDSCNYWRATESVPNGTSGELGWEVGCRNKTRVLGGHNIPASSGVRIFNEGAAILSV